MAKDWLKILHKMDGAVTDDYDPHNFVIQSRSPTLNFTFGKGYGLPLGYTLALGGPPKGGKTLTCYDFAGQLCMDDPDAHIVHLNTEFRSRVQSTAEQREKIWNIDPKRFTAYEVNAPEHVFDRTEQEFAAMCQDGWPLKLLIIDSIDGIVGRRSRDSDTVGKQQIGDWAQTLGDGFKRILAVQRKYKFAIIFTCQIRAEMDVWEQKKNNSKFKMKLPLALQHYAEYFMYVEPDMTKDGRTDLAGNVFEDESVTDVRDKSDRTGHKVRIKMKDSSCGPKGRGGEFTLDYNKGIINRHEEVFTLGVNRGVIERPNNTSYTFGEMKWVGKLSTLDALKDSRELQDDILKQIKLKDKAGLFAHDDMLAAAEVAD